MIDSESYPRGYPYKRAEELRPLLRALGLQGLSEAIGISAATLRRVLAGDPVYRLTAKRIDRFLTRDGHQ